MGGGVWEQTRFVVGKIGIDSCGDKPLQDAFKDAALCSQYTMIPRARAGLGQAMSMEG